MTRSIQLSIEQLAAELGCSRALIRFWEDEFGLNTRTRTALNDLDVAEIKLIYQLIEVQGLPLHEAKDQFSLSRQRLLVQQDSIENLTRLRKALLGLKSRLDDRNALYN